MAKKDFEDKKLMIDIILDGHEDDISNWIKTQDSHSLREWLRAVLRLDSMSISDLTIDFAAYLPDALEDEGE